MIVRKRAVLVAELISQRDSGLDDLGLGGSALPFNGARSKNRHVVLGRRFGHWNGQQEITVEA